MLCTFFNVSPKQRIGFQTVSCKIKLPVTVINAVAITVSVYVTGFPNTTDYRHGRKYIV